MPSLPLTISQPASPSVASGDGATAANPGSPDKTKENQLGGISFPALMKQISPVGKDKTADKLIAAITADGQTPAPQAGDAALPPAGMMLPFVTPQNPVTDSGQLAEGSDPGQGKGNGKGAKAIMAAVSGDGAAKQTGDKSDFSLTAGVTDSDSGISDATQKTTQSFLQLAQTANPLVTGSHDTHGGIQALMNDINTLTAGQHKGLVDNAHGVTDATNPNVSASSLLQTGDKIAPGVATTSIDVPLRHPEWSDELSSRINWMVGQDIQTASVKINPPHLGPLEVKVSLMNDQVNVSFATHHAPVRDALDASIPRLREMLGGNGLQLGDASVTHHSYSDNQQQSGQQSFSQSYPGQSSYGHDSFEPGLMGTAHQPLYYIGNGAIDIYA